MLNKPLKVAAQFMSGRGTAIFLIGAIVCGSVMGVVFPQTSNLASGQIDFTILLLVFLLLFEVRIQSVLASLNQMRFIIVALIVNFVIIPALGFAIASIFLSDYPLFSIGLVIYFMAPCTDWFLAFTRLAKGNTSLGAALLPINMIVQLLLYPAYLYVFGIEAINTSAADIFSTLWQWFLVPLLLAVILRFAAEKFASEKQLEMIGNIISLVIPILLSVLVGQISAANIGTLISQMTLFPLALFAILLFFVLNYFISEIISRFMRFSYEDSALLTITTAARNAPLMLALTVVVIPNQPLVYSAIIIGMLIELPHLIALKIILLRQSNNYKSRTIPV